MSLVGWSVILNNECLSLILFTGTWKSNFFIVFSNLKRKFAKFRHAIFFFLLGTLRPTIMFKVFSFVRRLDRKVNLNTYLCEILYWGVPKITDYKLEFITHKLKTMGPIRRIKIIKINRFGWNSVHGGFRGRWC